MRALRALGILILTAASSAAAQNNASAARHPLAGVWSRVAGVTDGNVVATQPGFRMFVDGYYSIVRVEGIAPRSLLPESPTPQQIRASYTSFTAQAGNYELTSFQTFTQRASVAYGPANMLPDRYSVNAFHIVGDTMWNSNILNRDGPIANPQLGKYVRVRGGGPSPLDGAWRMVDTRSADGKVTRNQPGMRLFVDGHFSVVRVDGMAPRPAAPGANATAAELTAFYGPFTGQHGTFEVSGQTVTTHALVAKNPGAMVPGNFGKLTYRIRGDSLWMSQVETQAGPVANPTTTKYVRVRATPPVTN